MSLILIMTIVQAVASTVAWLGSGARHAHQRRRGRYGLPDRARPGLRHAARVPSSLLCTDRHAVDRDERRSEEHTSELQSPTNPVCRLLPEKKKMTSGR